MATERKLYKLWIHEKQWDTELVINPDVFKDYKPGDIVGVEHNRATPSQRQRLLLQVTAKTLENGLALKDKGGTISISKDVAEVFQLQPREDVVVTKVHPDEVAVELVELSFKDQYIGRSDQWHLKNNLAGRCVYLKKNVQHAGMRAAVEEIWSNGRRLMCGRISNETKIVFRSSSAHMYLLIQVSPEMFDMESSGELLYEKAVDGFLAELTERWKTLSCNHEVSIILFGRNYITGAPAPCTPDDFSPELRPSLMQDAEGRFYFDSYLCVVQRTTRSDWTTVLVNVKKDILRFKDQLENPLGGPDSLLSRRVRRRAASLKRLSSATDLKSAEVAAAGSQSKDQTSDWLSQGSSSDESDGGIVLPATQNASLARSADTDDGWAGEIGTRVCPGPVPSFPSLPYTSQRGTGWQQGRLSLMPLGIVGKKCRFLVAYAQEGNFMEAVNLCLSAFDKHSINRNFERTGQLIVAVSAGVGVFEVSPDYTRLTKERLLDNGIGLDLVCVSRPPLHMVPLFINRNTQICSTPYWISLSFYSSEDRARARRPHKAPNFIPHCRAPELSATAAVSEPVLQAGAKGPFSLLLRSLRDGSAQAPAQSSVTESRAATAQLSQHAARRQHDRNLFASFGMPPERRAKLTENVPELVNNSSALSLSKMDEGFFYGEPGSNPRASTGSSLLISRSHTARPSQRASDASAVTFADLPSSNKSLGPHARRSQYMQSHSQSVPSAALPLHAPALSSLKSGLSRSPGGWSDGLSGSATDQDDSDDMLDDDVFATTPVALVRTGSERYFPEFARRRKKTAGSFESLHAAAGQERFWWGSGAFTVNPFKPRVGLARVSYSRRRWSHIFHHSFGDVHEMHQPNWKSLCVPACLPLTTDYFPSNEELFRNYTEKPYVVTVNDDEVDADDIEDKSEYMLDELVSQRLAQGFQIVVQADKTSDVAEASDKSGAFAGKKVRSYALSHGHTYHHLAYDPSDNNIEIKTYTSILKNDKIRKASDQNYKYRLWPENHASFQSVSISFKVQPVADINWNIIDHIILGYVDKEAMSTMRHINFWRTRFCLLPADDSSAPNRSEAEVVTKEAQRVANFGRLKQLINKASKPIMPDIPVLPFKATAYSLTQDSEVPGSKLDQHSSLDSILAAALSPNSGLPIGTRRLILRVHHRCFVGQVLLDWLMKKIPTLKQRDDAFAIAQRLLNEGYIKCVTSRSKMFKDGYVFYSVTKTPAGFVSEAEGGGGGGDKRLDLKLSECVVFDQGKGSRHGWVVMHFDSHYNPLRPYHVEFHWMVSSACMMEELLQLFQRKARSCKLLFVPLPIGPLRLDEANIDPFYAPLFIPLALNFGFAFVEDINESKSESEEDTEQVDEVRSTASRYDFMAVILAKFDFMVDTEADTKMEAMLGQSGTPRYTYLRPQYDNTQWVHRSGGALVQAVDSDDSPGFLWTHNYLLTSKWRSFSPSGSAANDNSAVWALMRKFQAFCSSINELTALYKSVSSPGYVHRSSSASLVDLDDTRMMAHA